MAVFLHRSPNRQRDLNGLYVLLRVKLAIHRHLRSGSTIPSIFSQQVALHPDKPALVYEATGETWTFFQLDRLSNAVAYWALGQGWGPGDVVALYLESRPSWWPCGWVWPRWAWRRRSSILT
ncbi:hypothetical protein AGOR_G00196440 [Albula goreensis]|uniref:Long-chain-fatty-acid--CoA ligase n=1 Tax=Albula goreensis TaxID=1534307 RepID=A0A8T3CV63_9TELE|nr:hypothetical protein AGOR_G00196440 [Albula goreensis]